MDVTLRIKNIELSGDYDTIEFVYKNTCSIIQDVVTFTIVNLQDFLFEKITFRLKSRGRIWDKYLGIINIQNSRFKERELKNNEEVILSHEYIFKTDFYDFNNFNVIGKFFFDYSIVYDVKKYSNEYINDKFAQKMFNLFLDQERSVLLMNFKSVVDEFLMGSQRCKMNFLIGVYLIEKYTTNLHYKTTKNLRYEDIKDLQVLKVCDIKKETKDENFSLEEFLLGKSKQFKFEKISDFTNFTPTVNKKPSTDLIKNDKKYQLAVENENNKFNIFEKVSSLLTKKETVEDILVILESSMSDMLNVDNMASFSAENMEEDFSDVLINFKSLFHVPNNSYSIDDTFDNTGYTVANRSLLTNILNLLYFAIGSYGDSWATLFCKRRMTVDKSLKLDSNRKGILEFLNIDNNKLLSVQMADEDVPEYIIFLDKENERIVLSFKGTSTSDEALKDLNCRYTKFYDGFSHKGFAHMACAFVKNKTKELFKILENYKTKDLLITGHSLGGSIAILVHLIYLKNNLTKFYNITTVAFAPAPVVSYNLASKKYGNIFIINYGNDFVPRTSYGSFNEMKYAACSIGSKSGFLSSVDNINQDIRTIKSFTQKKNKFPKLYCPGNNYHFKRLNVIKHNKKISIIVYKQVEVNFFESLIVIRHASIHHMLPHLLNAFNTGILDYDEIDNKS